MKTSRGGIERTKTISNYSVIVVKENGKEIEKKIPKSAEQIAFELFELTNNFPKRIGSELFGVLKNNEIVRFKEPSSLFGYLGNFGIKCIWSQTEGMVTKGEFCEYVKQNAQNYEAVTKLPHYPAYSQIYYAIPSEANTKKNTYQGSALDTLINFFNPATPEDRSLIKAAVATLFWGGPLGGRPAFFIEGNEGDGRGYGKTTLVDSLSQLAGGYIDCSLADGDEIKKRILNEAGDKRLLRVDNIKTNRVSSSSFEKAITMPYISGHKMYVGTCDAPNILTFFLTINDACLSKDMAQRSIRIKIKKPAYDPSWLDRLQEHIQFHKWQIIAEVLEILSRSEIEPLKQIRFSKWQKGVLNKIDSSEHIVNLIQSRQLEVDDDGEDGDDLVDYFSCELAKYQRSGAHSSKHIDPERDSVFIKKAIAAQWYSNCEGLKNISVRQATKLLKRKIPWLHEIKLKEARCFFWHKPTHLERVDASNLRGGWFIGELNSYNWLQFREIHSVGDADYVTNR